MGSTLTRDDKRPEEAPVVEPVQPAPDQEGTAAHAAALARRGLEQAKQRVDDIRRRAIAGEPVPAAELAEARAAVELEEMRLPALQRAADEELNAWRRDLFAFHAAAFARRHAERTADVHETRERLVLALEEFSVAVLRYDSELGAAHRRLSEISVDPTPFGWHPDGWNGRKAQSVGMQVAGLHATLADVGQMVAQLALPADPRSEGGNQ